MGANFNPLNDLFRIGNPLVSCQQLFGDYENSEENIKILPDSLHVEFKNKLDDNFPNIWLRDHAKDDENWNQSSHQRKTYTANLDPKLFIEEASVSENGDYINMEDFESICKINNLY